MPKELTVDSKKLSAGCSTTEEKLSFSTSRLESTFAISFNVVIMIIFSNCTITILFACLFLKFFHAGVIWRGEEVCCPYSGSLAWKQSVIIKKKREKFEILFSSLEKRDSWLYVGVGNFWPHGKDNPRKMEVWFFPGQILFGRRSAVKTFDSWFQLIAFLWQRIACLHLSLCNLKNS